jgi:CO dehydrogenase maturation factor
LSYNIAVAGKGGSGKTTIAALVIRYLLNKKNGPILAVDADPNANLADSLGMQAGGTVGQILDSFQKEKIGIPPGMTKEAYLEYKLHGIVVESSGMDLLVMGRGEGPECYCYPNVMLRKLIDELSGNYAYVILDNEAGLEHLSRRTTQNIDDLLMVSGHSVKGVRAVAQITQLVAELNLSVKRQSVIINGVRGEMDPAVASELAKLNLKPSAVIPWDEEVYNYDLKLKPLTDLTSGSKAIAAVDGFLDRLLSVKAPSR